MSKAIEEISIGAAIVGAMFIPGVGAFLGPTLTSFLVGTGASMLMTGVGTLIAGQPQGGIAAASRNPIQPWTVVYGRAKAGGTIVYIEETGDDDKYLHLVVVLACHPCQSVDTLLFDDQPVLLDASGNSYSPTQQKISIGRISRSNGVVTVKLASALSSLMEGQQIQIANVSDKSYNGTYQISIVDSQTFTYICGGNDGTSGGGYAKTTFPDYKDKVHMEVLLGDHTSTFPGLLAESNGIWSSQHLLLGRTAVYLKLHYNDSVFSNGLPNIAFLVHGKKDIYDPRTGSYGYTENAALCIADYLAHPIWGFSCAYGSEIPTQALVGAANICDEVIPLAHGGTEPRYTCNGTFTLATKRGEVLQNLLTACGGRLTYSGGQFVIHPAAWTGATITVGEAGGSPSTSGASNMLMNSDGLVVNAYNNQSGRGDYFDQASGTSEGQFLMILGLLDAYNATGNVVALTLANKALHALIPVLYRGIEPPASVDDDNSWAPHWLFAVKGPITSCRIRYDRTFSFTNGRCVIPDSGFTTTISSNAPAFSTTGVHVKTLAADGSGIFNATSSTTILSEQDVSSLMFNTHPKSILPGDPHDSGNQASPMVCNTVDSLGQYAGDTTIANGTGIFSLDLTGSFIVTEPGNYTFSAYVNSCYIVGIEGATYVSGDRYAGGYSTTPFKGYKVVGALQDLAVWNSEKQGAWGALSTFTVNFPAAGIYPYEIGFAAGLYHEKQFCLLANGSVIPLVNEETVVSIQANGKVHRVFQAVTPGYKLLWNNPYSSLTLGVAYPIASAIYDESQNGTVVTLSDSSFQGTLGIIYSTQDGETIAKDTPYEAWPDWRLLDDGEIDAACDTFNWALRAYQEASTITGDPLWKRAVSATLQQASLAYNLDDQRDWIKRSWTKDPFSEGSRFKYSARSSSPAFSCDNEGNVLIDVPYDPAGGEVQYANASIGDTYASGDSTVVLVGSSIVMNLTLFLDTKDQTNYNDANRYRVILPLTGSGLQSFTLQLSDFKNSSGTTLASGSSVYSVGIDDTEIAAHTITLGRIRQLPNIPMRYVPGSVIPFTSNYSNGVQIDWRGPYYSGYQSPWAIKQMGNEANVAGNVQFLADAQRAYSTMTGQGTGPFAPVYIPNRKDGVQYGTADSWTWSGPDPNTKWGGYQYRPLKELAYLVKTCDGSESYYSQAVTIADNFLSWIDTQWTSGGPPTDFIQGAVATTYDEPHFAGQILHAVLLMDLAKRPEGDSSGVLSSIYRSLISKAFNYLSGLYVSSGTMAGTFCADVENQSWFGFWHGEIMRSLTCLVNWAMTNGQAAMAAQARTWLNGMVSSANMATVSTTTAAAQSLSDIIGNFTWKQKLSARDSYNGVKGVYICPSNRWEQADVPPYAQDEKHGYSNGPAKYDYDVNLAEDLGERRWKDVQLPFTISAATAQRLLKVELMRIRQQGNGTFPMSMRLYQASAMDVVSMTLPLFDWNQKLFEITAHRFTFNKQNSGGSNEAVILGTELDLQETSPSIYDWSVTEELTPQGYQQAVLPDTTSVAVPVALALESGADTVVTGADGLKRSRIKVTWSPPPDGYVTNGGHIELQYQQTTDTGWTGLTKVDPSITQYYIDSVTDGLEYNVRIRAVNTAGYPSDWVEAGPCTVSKTYSSFSSEVIPSTVSVNGVSIG